MKESDLYEPIKQFLLNSGCSNVYAEVLNCDVLGINGASNVIVEMKTTLSFKVIDQALDRLRAAQYVYIAIPKRKNGIPRCVRQILTQNKIGLLEIDAYNRVKITLPARYNRLSSDKRKVTQIRKHIKDYSEEATGGVKSGENVTDYSIMIANIKRFMKYRDWVTVDEILDYCEVHYANPRPSVTATLKAEWNANWCESKVEGRKSYFRSKERIQ